MEEGSEIKQTPINNVHNVDVLRLMRPDVAKVVEVGSSSGALARAYRQINPACSYVGIEIDRAYAEASRQHCTEVIYGNVEKLNDQDFAELGDAKCWVFADALEHLYDPWQLLRRIANTAGPGAEVVACIPNAQYWGIQSCLNSGKFIYQDSGLLDRTHIRWLTRLTIIDLFQANGFRVVEMISRILQQPGEEMLAGLRQIALASGNDPELAVQDAIPFQYVLRAVVDEAQRAPNGVTSLPAQEANPLCLYHIAYSKETLAAAPPGFGILNNLDTDRSDWREYWPIRKFLLEESLNENGYYGFFSPRFKEKTGLGHAAVSEFVRAAGADTDVVLFSPQPDMGAFFLNIFEQEELFQPGFIAASEAFLAAAGMPLQLAGLLMDSRQLVFSNYFVARPRFWREWLTWNEKLFALCEESDSALKQSLVFATAYPGAVQRKVFLMERMASLLLTTQPQWKVRAYNTFACAWSASRLNQFKSEAVMSDALKMALKEQGFDEYRQAFAALRDKLR